MGMIEEILRELGIGANYRAFNLLIVTVSLVVENPDYLLRITKELYPEVGRRCGCAGTAVEHNIRAAARRAWNLRQRPSLSICWRHMLREHARRSKAENEKSVCDKSSQTLFHVDPIGDISCISA